MADGNGSSPATRPSWSTVDELLRRLGETQEPFDAAGTRQYRIVRYERDWRVMLEGGASTRWVELETIRACWETFERLGRIQREDVLEPGRCASFMLALFDQLPGVERAHDDAATLVLA
jgi:hypothetical protein